MNYNFYSKALDGTITPETMDYIVDKNIGHDNIIYNDTYPYLTNLTLTGVNQTNSDDRILYINLTKPGADTLLQFYSNSGRTALVASHTIVGGIGGAGLTIIQENSSGISGTVTIAYMLDDTDIYLEWGDGSEDAPYKTINVATAAASTGDKVGLASGYYNEISASKVLKFYGTGICISNGITSVNSGSELYNLIITNSITLYGGSYYDCEFSGNIANYQTTALLFHNCILRDLTYYNSSGGVAGNYFYKCVLDNFTWNATNSKNRWHHVSNTIIIDSNINVDSSGAFAGTGISDYNCLYNSNISIENVPFTLAQLQSTYTPDWINSFEDDPLFNDYVNGDYTLQAISPCIGAGSIEGNVKLNMGAKAKAKSITATDLFNNADSTVNCELDSGSIIISQHDLQVSGYNNGDFTKVYLHSSASGVDDYYNGLKLTFTSGTGVGNNVLVTDYDGSSKIATIDTAITQDLGSFYSIGMSLESADIDAGSYVISGSLNLNGLLNENTVYDSDHTDLNNDVYIKWADTQGGLSGANYELMNWNQKVTFDSSNSAGNADPNYDTGDEFSLIWFKIKFEAYIKI